MTASWSTEELKINLFGSVTGRAGVAWDAALFYAKGGFAWAYRKDSISVPEFGPTFSDSQTHTGYTIGGGVEYLFTPNWSAKAEYMYTSLGSKTYNLGSELTVRLRHHRLPHHQDRRELSLQVKRHREPHGPDRFQQLSPAKAGDPLLRRQQALAWAKALAVGSIQRARADARPMTGDARPPSDDDPTWRAAGPGAVLHRLAEATTDSHHLQHQLHRHQHRIVAAHQPALGKAAGVVDKGNIQLGFQRTIAPGA